MAPKQTDPQFKLRLTPEVKETIEKAASQNNRSMNAEILARLEATIASGASGFSQDERISQIVAKVGKIESLLEEKAPRRSGSDLTEASAGDEPLTIPEAKRRLALSFAVDASTIKITIEA